VPARPPASQRKPALAAAAPRALSAALGAGAQRSDREPAPRGAHRRRARPGAAAAVGLERHAAGPARRARTRDRDAAPAGAERSGRGARRDACDFGECARSVARVGWVENPPLRGWWVFNPPYGALADDGRDESRRLG